MKNLTEEPKQIKCYCGHTTTCDCSPLEPKQETVEEAARRYTESTTDNEPVRIFSFINGAKYMAERMYSEEEVLKLLITFSDDRTFLKKNVAIKWFNKFKKK
jgi:hypothetical protein